MYVYEVEKRWKCEVLVKQRNFPGFFPEVRTLKESQDNGCCGRD